VWFPLPQSYANPIPSDIRIIGGLLFQHQRLKVWDKRLPPNTREKNMDYMTAFLFSTMLYILYGLVELFFMEGSDL
jgi:hypothetical protein